MFHEQSECSIGDPAFFVGGKTASLKAVGLTAIMAKAGLFIPTAHRPPEHSPNSVHRQEHSKEQQQLEQQQAQQQEPRHLDAHLSDKLPQQGSQYFEAQQREQQQQQQSQHPDPQQSDKLQEQQQQQPPMLAFFDKVLADVGDSQNLQQSLSTFSGHIRRVRSILQQATPHSLVLLDEVGMPLLARCLSVCSCLFFYFISMVLIALGFLFLTSLRHLLLQIWYMLQAACESDSMSSLLSS